MEKVPGAFVVVPELGPPPVTKYTAPATGLFGVPAGPPDATKVPRTVPVTIALGQEHTVPALSTRKVTTAARTASVGSPVSI